MEVDIVSDLLSNGPWPPAIGEHLAIKYCFDPINIGEFVGFFLQAGSEEIQEILTGCAKQPVSWAR